VLAERWSEGEMTARFEAAWSDLHGLGSVATGGWSGAALAALDFAGVRGGKVLCPSNTFMATPLAIVHSEAEPVFVRGVKARAVQYEPPHQGLTGASESTIST
jgi:dTDP-4-amino-4,6-dideoxygalactose transaminase